MASTSTIFVGSSINLDTLDAAAIANPLLSDGDVGFYGHMSGVIGTYMAGTEAALLSTWSGTGAGLVELVQTEPMAVMSVTIQNTSAAAIVLPIGTIVSSASGVQYQIVQKPRQETGWSNATTGTGTTGAYTIPAGQSLTLYTQALQDGPSGNLLANQVTQIGVSGAQVTASSLITAAPQWGAGTLTLTNNSGASQIIYEGTVVNGSGGAYEIGVNPSVTGFVPTDADSSSGYYVLAAGATITVPIGSVATITATTENGVVTQELAENAAANSITSGALPTGVSITSSSAITTTGVTTAAAQGHVTNLGANTGFLTDAQAELFTTSQGYVPTEADVDTYNDYIWTKQDLVNWQAYVDSARAQGILNLAPMMSEFETVDFGTAAATQYARAGALYSGGIAFDMPSWFFLVRESAYQVSVENEIKWATQNGLRSSITLSPESGNDTNFLADTQQVVAMLKAAGALPTQFVVKDGGVTGSAVIYSTSDPNSLNNVAAWLSSLSLTPSNSESGLETRGTSARPDDLMTGVQQAETITGPTAVQPFSIAQLFAEAATTTATLTVTLGNVALGTLSTASGTGSVSANGSVFTMTGKMSALTLALQSLSFSAATAALGSTTLTTTLVDSAGTITGSTAISVDNALALSGVPATLSATQPVALDPSLVLSAGPQTATLGAIITLSNVSLGSFWNISGATLASNGSTLSLTGSAATLQAFLRQLAFMATPGASGNETLRIAVTDGTQTVSSSTVIAVSATTGLAIGNVPATTVSAPLVLDAPYQDIVIANGGNPSLVMTATVTLPSGTAILVSPGTGTLASNGLSYTVTGTAAQLQMALRGLQLSVPASATSSTEALTLGINGLTKTTMVKTVSTDTFYIGAVDSTEGTYGNSAIAAPLLATGSVGLLEDYNGMTATVIAGTSGALQSTWAGTSAGIFAYSEGSDVALQTITVKNTGTTPITVPVGTLASTASGVQFQVVQYNGTNANWSAGTTGDGSLGVYTIAAGSSITVPVEALQQGYVGNVADNAITTLAGIANAAITASTASALATEYASGTVTLTNTTSGYIVVYEGTTVSNSTGTYAIGNDPSAAYYSGRLADNSAGVYYLAPGGSTTVPIYSTNPQTASTPSGVLGQIVAQTTSATNTITSTALPAGISIASSSAITLTGPTTAAAGAAWGGWGPGTGVLTDRGYGSFLSNQGFTPSEVNTNINLSTQFTAADLTSWQGYVDTLRAFGMMNVAVTVTTSAVLDLSSSNATAALRSAALYGGGIDVDLPANYLLSLGSTALTAMGNDFTWAANNGLRSTLVLRAYSDANYIQNAETLLGQLKAAGTLPSQVVLVDSLTGTTAASTSLTTALAGYVGTLTLTPSVSESSLSSTAGTTALSIMTGVQKAEAAVGSAGITPYAGVQVFAESATDAMTAIVALNNAGLGVLSTTGSGTLSADRSTVTIAGTPSAIQAALRAIVYTPAAGMSGSTGLDLSISDANGTIQGQTLLTVTNPTIAVPLAVAVLGSGNGSGTTTITVGTLASQGDTLSATAGGTIANGVFTISGTTATDQAALAGLRVTPGSRITSVGYQVGLSGAGVSFTDSGSGADTITSAGGNSITGGSGTATIMAGLSDTISAGSGSLQASGSKYFVFTGNASVGDTVTGGAGGGYFKAGTGGSSLLTAGTGNTTIFAGGSNDTLVGGGHATLLADNYATVIRATGGDTVTGSYGSVISGPANGTATINAAKGSETILGGAGAMSVAGGTGGLTMKLGSGTASVTGSSGGMTITGGLGGSASIMDGTGSDVISLQKGISTGAQLTLSDFTTAKDMISLTGYGTGAAQQLVQSQSSVGGGTVLSLPDGATITISGLAHITAANITSV